MNFEKSWWQIAVALLSVVILVGFLFQAAGHCVPGSYGSLRCSLPWTQH
jgi:hypothetical protein